MADSVAVKAEIEFSPVSLLVKRGVNDIIDFSEGGVARASFPAAGLYQSRGKIATAHAEALNSAGIWPASLSPTGWYKADSLALNDGDAVGSWADSSGNGRTITQANAVQKPTFHTDVMNGRPAVYFDGSDDEMTTGLAASTFFGVHAKTAIALVYVDSDVSLGNVPILFCDTSSKVLAYLSTGPSWNCWNKDAGALDIATKTPVTLGAWHIVMYRHDATNVSAAIDNEDSSALANTASGDTSSLAGTLAIGGSLSGFNFWKGYVAELLLFNTALSEENCRRVVRYLKEKWAVTGDATSAPTWGNTYTVTNNERTRKFTAARSAGADTFSLLTSSGANSAKSAWNTLNYSTGADHTGATSYVSDLGGLEDVTADLLLRESINGRRGIRDPSPAQRLASAGTCTVLLDNSVFNSGGKIGYYSPDHANLRTGFVIGRLVVISVQHTVDSTAGFPAPLASAYVASGGQFAADKIQFRGTISKISPIEGEEGANGCNVTIVDWMEEAAKNAVGGVPAQLNVRADQAMQTILDGQSRIPQTVSLDQGSDVWPICLDAIGLKDKVVDELRHITESEFGFTYLLADETFRLENRLYRFQKTDTLAAAISEGIINFAPDHSTDRITNLARVTAHPRSVDADFSELYSMPSSAAVFVPPGGSVTIQAQYIDPDNPSTKVGAVDVVEALVPGSDYVMSTVDTEVTEIPDTVETTVPNAQGTYSNFLLGSGASKVIAVSDGIDGTYVEPDPSTGLQPETYKFPAITATPRTSAANYVKMHYRIQIPGTPGGSVFYPLVRLNGVDLLLTDEAHIFVKDAVGIYDFDIFVPRPGGGDWTVGDVNDAEFGGEFNWSYSGRGRLLDMSRAVAYTAQSAIPVDHDKTADFTVTVDAGANSASITAVNNGDSGATIVKLKLRGRIIRIMKPITMESRDEASLDQYGERSVDVDMLYQSSAIIAKAAGDYLISQDASPRTHFDGLGIYGNRSRLFMVYALGIDISHRISVNATVSGVNGEFYVNGVDFRIDEGPLVYVTWILAPSISGDIFIIDQTGRDEIDEDNVVGPF